MTANCLVDMAEKLTRVEKTGLLPEIPTDAPDLPQMTQCAEGKRDLSVMNACEGFRGNASAKPSGSVGIWQSGSARRAAATQRAASF